LFVPCDNIVPDKIAKYDFESIIKSKDWAYGKKQKYYKNAIAQLQGTISHAGSFRTMVKSG